MKILIAFSLLFVAGYAKAEQVDCYGAYDAESTVHAVFFVDRSSGKISNLDVTLQKKDGTFALDFRMAPQDYQVAPGQRVKVTGVTRGNDGLKLSMVIDTSYVAARGRFEGQMTFEEEGRAPAHEPQPAECYLN